MSLQSDAVDTVSAYLRLVEARCLDDAAEYLARDALITFPGGRQFRSLEEQVTDAAGRYRKVRKVVETVESFARGDAVVVYVLGTLQGEDMGGDDFSGVRFVDRFELREGRIVDHKVWNDMAEMGVVEPRRAAGR